MLVIIGRPPSHVPGAKIHANIWAESMFDGAGMIDWFGALKVASSGEIGSNDIPDFLLEEMIILGFRKVIVV